jgi:hypothetical protein
MYYEDGPKMDEDTEIVSSIEQEEKVDLSHMNNSQIDLKALKDDYEEELFPNYY